MAAGGALAAALPELEEVPGIGLGLYLARNVIEMTGGRISVESEVGRGSALPFISRCGVMGRNNHP